MKGSHPNNQRRSSSGGGSASGTTTQQQASSNAPSAVRSSCKTMQRKLEQKVERTRNLLTHKLPLQTADPSLDPKNPPLMPVGRMRIPGQPDCLPLVDYRDDKHSRRDDDDDDEDVDFYPIPKKSTAKHELSDTFSLHEMTICGTDEDDDEDDDRTNVDTRTGAIFDDDEEDDDDDSQTLEFLSPKLVRGRSWKDRCSQVFCCGHSMRL